MTRFILKRVGQAVFSVWVVVTLVFALIHLTGNPIAVLAPETMSAHDRVVLAKSLGVDQPILVQYARYLMGVLHGNLGLSYYSGQPAMRLLLERVPVTVELVVLAIAIATAFGLPFGIFSAVWPDSALDRALRGVSVLGSSVPTFFLGILLIFAFSVELHVLPASGAGSIEHYIMPAFTLAFFRIALFTRLTRTSLLDTLSQNYVRTARAKGLPEPVIVLKHALRTAMLPLITVFGLQFGQLFAGAVITETIFALPGMNRLALESLYRLDYPVVLSYVIVVAAMFAAINLVMDLLYGVFDPRVAHAR
ncbi:MAG TPA: ABC transporter permease [Acetobacteraceae bacterium]|jgi:peptide/nickel transport system permease protein|nr:ABC transporter permease [Acetobacteraceae bacterium]